MLVYDTNANRYYKEWFGTQADYDKITIKEKNTKYGVRQTNNDIKFFFFGYDSTVLEGEKRNTTTNIKDGIQFDEWIGNEGEFSAITNRRGNTKYSVVNNNSITDYIKIADKADSRLSLSVAGGPFGLEVYNVSDDPMPIKTIDNAGLSVYEETEDYYIVMDKNRVETVVQNYVVGTSDIFYSRMRDIENSQSLMRGYSISWSKEDSSKMLLDINSEQLEKLAQTPSLMPYEEDAKPLTLETKTIPTSYMCCIRVDKKTGEIYSSEGYENFWVNEQAGTNSGRIELEKDNDWTVAKMRGVSNKINFMFIGQAVEKANFPIGLECWVNAEIEIRKNLGNLTLTNTIQNFVNNKVMIDKKIISVSRDYQIFIGKVNSTEINFDINQVDVAFRKLQLTKTLTKKPFVNSIFPNGKLEFESTANETTHTFLNKGDGVITFGSGSFSLKGEKTEQLLVYKGLLTEQEKQAELAKTIRLR